MKLDFKKIINIKNLKDLKKYKLDKPIHFNNYLFHYLIIFNKLDILKLYEFPIWKENEYCEECYEKTFGEEIKERWLDIHTYSIDHNKIENRYI